MGRRLGAAHIGPDLPALTHPNTESEKFSLLAGKIKEREPDLAIRVNICWKRTDKDLQMERADSQLSLVVVWCFN